MGLLDRQWTLINGLIWNDQLKKWQQVKCIKREEIVQWINDKLYPRDIIDAALPYLPQINHKTIFVGIDITKGVLTPAMKESLQLKYAYIGHIKQDLVFFDKTFAIHIVGDFYEHFVLLRPEQQPIRLKDWYKSPAERIGTPLERYITECRKSFPGCL